MLLRDAIFGAVFGTGIGTQASGSSSRHRRYPKPGEMKRSRVLRPRQLLAGTFWGLSEFLGLPVCWKGYGPSRALRLRRESHLECKHPAKAAG